MIGSATRDAARVIAASGKLDTTPMARIRMIIALVAIVRMRELLSAFTLRWTYLQAAVVARGGRASGISSTWISGSLVNRRSAVVSEQT